MGLMYMSFFSIQMQSLPFEKDLHGDMEVQEVILSSQRWECESANLRKLNIVLYL